MTIAEADVIEPLSLAEAQALDARVRRQVRIVNGQARKLHGNLCGLLHYVNQAKEGNIHTTLGYKSWPDYVASTVKIKGLPAKKRRELVWFLSGEGMSQRILGDILCVDQSTVSRDLRDAHASPEPVTGRDGKTYKRKPEVKPSVADQGLPVPALDDDGDPTTDGRITDIHQGVTRILNEFLGLPNLTQAQKTDAIRCVNDLIAKLEGVRSYLSDS